MSAREELLAQFAFEDWEDGPAVLGRYRAEVIAEVKIEVVDWLVKKAREKEPCDAATLASKADRGAVRIFLGAGHYLDAMDAHRAEVLREAADYLNKKYGVTNRAASSLRHLAELEAQQGLV